MYDPNRKAEMFLLMEQSEERDSEFLSLYLNANNLKYDFLRRLGIIDFHSDLMQSNKKQCTMDQVFL